MLSITRTFREKLIKRYPGLSRNPAYWRLLHFLLFGTFRDRLTDELVISSDVLATIEGLAAKVKHRNYRAQEFLDAFQADVLPGFRYSDWKFVDNQARTVVATGLDPEVFTWVDEMVDALATGEPDVVDLETGLAQTRAAQAKADRDDLARVEQSLTPDVAPATRDVVEYQNGLPKRGFSEVVQAHKEAAARAVDDLTNPESVRQVRSALATVLLHPKPIVRPVQNSARAFNVRLSLLSLKGSIRRIFTQEWVDYDLKSAQLAIVAREWDIPELRAFLESGQSVWTHLTTELGVPAASKPAVKEAVYSLVFGASKGTISTRLASELGTNDDRGFFDIKLVNLVYKAREERAEALLQAKEGTTIYGRRIKIAWAPWPERMDVARSILAQQAQALELHLIHPIYELAKTTNQFHVMLYQFDGVTIRYRDKRTAKSRHARITNAVDRRARELGIPTNLEWDPGSAFTWNLEQAPVVKPRSGSPP